MIAVSTIIACIISLLISLVLPIAALLFVAARNKQQGIVSAWLLGAAGFFVTQMLIRVPVLMVLQSQSWFAAFSQNHLFLYAFSLAFTAGLFELAGRFGVAKLLKKRGLTFHRSLTAGLGHGGIEAILLVGMTYVNNLIYIFMIQTGSFDALLSQVAGNELAIAQLQTIREQLLTTSPILFLLGGFERLLAMVSHTAMSTLVCYGVAHRKTLPCLALCLGIHTLMDLTAGISLLIGNGLSQTAAYIIIYTILTIAAGASLFILRKLHCCWQKEEDSYDSEE